MASRCWVPVACGPLARYAGGYGAWLAARGYSRWTIAHRLWQLELLSRWLECEGFSSSDLTPARVEAFLAARRAAGYSSWVRGRDSNPRPSGYEFTSGGRVLADLQVFPEIRSGQMRLNLLNLVPGSVPGLTAAKRARGR